MKAPHGSVRDKDVLVHWNAAYSQWASAAAWYGLHGHLYMGCVAALNSMRDVRLRIRDAGFPNLDFAETMYPGGELASAKYSIAKLLCDEDARIAILREALEDANREISTGADPHANALSVRAAIVGALGDRAASVRDYEEVLRCREAATAGPGPMGVALSNLGFAYLLRGSLWKGRCLIETGVQLLSENPPLTHSAGFLARAKRKLASAYLLTGRPIRAYREAQEAEQIARSAGALDQTRR